MHTTYARPHCVIVGLGPAGLAAAHALRAIAPHLSLTCVEAGLGPAHRRRDDAAQLVSGVGGAGLFSDGKFSFYPSATALWTLEDKPLLRSSYAWTCRWLERYGLIAPTLNTSSDHQHHAPIEDGFKPYPAHYMGLDERLALIQALFEPLRAQTRLQTRHINTTQRPGQSTLTVHLQDEHGRISTLEADALILATGRFGPLQTQRAALKLPHTFRRVERGVRIEGDAQHPFFAHLEQLGESLDPKWISRDERRGLEWRTFCYCKRGESVLARWDSQEVYSGRADGPPTQRSNVGFNVRWLRPDDAPDPLKTQAPYTHALHAALRDHSLEPALEEGLLRLGRQLPALLDERAGALQLIGPTLEGVGAYPSLDHALLTHHAQIAVAGDCGGLFRGLTGALVSGYYAATKLAQATLTATPHAA